MLYWYKLFSIAYRIFTYLKSHEAPGINVVTQTESALETLLEQLI